jgi:hypothetical protein
MCLGLNNGTFSNLVLKLTVRWLLSTNLYYKVEPAGGSSVPNLDTSAPSSVNYTNFMKSKRQLESDIGPMGGQKGKKLAGMASFILQKMAIDKKRDHINLQTHNPEIILMLLVLRENFPFIIVVRFWLFHVCFNNET